jgi:hypothetical protein
VRGVAARASAHAPAQRESAARAPGHLQVLHHPAVPAGLHSRAGLQVPQALLV